MSKIIILILVLLVIYFLVKIFFMKLYLCCLATHIMMLKEFTDYIDFPDDIELKSYVAYTLKTRWKDIMKKIRPLNADK